jgi:hypothetical protein
MDYFGQTPAPYQPAAYAPPPPAPARQALPLEALGLGLGAVLLVVSAFLPWISIFAFGVSGIDLRYGVVALVAGILSLVAAAEAATGSVVGPARRSLVHGVAVVAGLGSAIAALAVWTRLRQVLSDLDGFAGLGGELSFDESAPSPDDPFAAGFGELGQQLADALAPQAAAGLWLALAAGLLVAGSAVVAIRR